jgi:hypothetical protein
MNHDPICRSTGRAFLHVWSQVEGENFRRTQLLKDGPSVEARAEEWRAKLAAGGWVGEPPSPRRSARAWNEWFVSDPARKRDGAQASRRDC